MLEEKLKNFCNGMKKNYLSSSILEVDDDIEKIKIYLESFLENNKELKEKYIFFPYEENNKTIIQIIAAKGIA